MADTVKNNARNTENEDFSVSLADIWSMFWDYIWWYVLALFVCIFVAGVYLYRTPNTYSRSAKVIVSQEGADATMMNLMDFSGITTPRMGSSFFANNEVEAFSSHDLMEQVVSRLSLETSYRELQYLRDEEMYRNNPIEA
ncbi:MAG: Wzz/FepE/Etk N-terminal domain-containing protein [Candidatus Cryptobacteroides sp.]